MLEHPEHSYERLVAITEHEYASGSSRVAKTPNNIAVRGTSSGRMPKLDRETV